MSGMEDIAKMVEPINRALAEIQSRMVVDAIIARGVFTGLELIRTHSQHMFWVGVQETSDHKIAVDGTRQSLCGAYMWSGLWEWGFANGTFELVRRSPNDWEWDSDRKTFKTPPRSLGDFTAEVRL